MQYHFGTFWRHGEQCEEILTEALSHARHYGESLNRQATLLTVTHMIQAVTVHALARLGYPIGALPRLEQFTNDISTLVCAPNSPPTRPH